MVDLSTGEETDDSKKGTSPVKEGENGADVKKTPVSVEKDKKNPRPYNKNFTKFTGDEGHGELIYNRLNFFAIQFWVYMYLCSW